MLTRFESSDFSSCMLSDDERRVVLDLRDEEVRQGRATSCWQILERLYSRERAA